MALTAALFFCYGVAAQQSGSLNRVISDPSKWRIMLPASLLSKPAQSPSPGPATQQQASVSGPSQPGTIVLNGLLEDQAAVPITDVKVTLTNKATSQKLEATTDTRGHFIFVSVAPGDYTFKARADHYETIEMDVKVNGQTLPPLRLQMKVSIKDEVTITDSRSKQVTLQENNANTVNIDDDLLRELPIPTKSQGFVSFIGHFLSPAAQGTDEMSVLVDGVETFLVNIPVWSIRRVLINRNPYSAEYRRPGKARVEIITQDGSHRHFHGGFGMTASDAVFNARNPFALTRPDYNSKLLEANFSGILPGKIGTFFWSGERLMENSQSLINAVTPTGLVNRHFPGSEHYTYMLGRMDFTVNKIHSLTARFEFDSQINRNRGVGGFSLPELARNSGQREHRFQFSARSIFSAELLNEFRLILDRNSRREGNAANGPRIDVIAAFSTGFSQTFRQGEADTIELQDMVSLYRGRHSFRFGARVRPKYISNTDAANFGGTFEFANLQQYALGLPTVFRVNQGEPKVYYKQHEGDVFFQDEIKLRPNLSVMLGLRYDWQINIKDHDNFVPRIAFTYAPGDQKTVIRGGVGIFNERLTERITERSMLYDGLRVRELVIDNPSFPNPFTGQGTQVGQQLPSVLRVDPNLTTPSTTQASISLERVLWNRTTFTVEYATLRGIHLFHLRNINAPLPGTGVRPNPNFFNINQVESGGRLRSNALAFTFRGRIGNFFKGVAQYTYSRSFNDTNGAEPGAGFPFALPVNNYDRRPEYGRADFDRRHRFTLAGTLEFPHGFRMASVLTLASNAPYTITTGFDNNRDSETNDRPIGVGRNTGIGPGISEFDVRFTKVFRVPRPFNTDRQSENLELSIDLFNAFNHPNYPDYIGIQSSPFFGRPSSAQEGRRVQFSIRYTF
jgi:hypothetical protein